VLSIDVTWGCSTHQLDVIMFFSMDFWI
jgi:hypothetical protein